jgi:hypothetical protein
MAGTNDFYIAKHNCEPEIIPNYSIMLEQARLSAGQLP